MLPVGKAIKHFRIDGKMTQRALAESSGVHRSYIIQIEQDKKGSNITTLERIAYALGCEVWQLLKYAKELQDRERSDVV